jgi:hypothetical protein
MKKVASELKNHYRKKTLYKVCIPLKKGGWVWVQVYSHKKYGDKYGWELLDRYEWEEVID